ncbi:MAG: choline-sulfatase [Anaerolineales bacterium]
MKGNEIMVDTQKPNVLLIMADQLTALALGCYGNPTVQTPAIDNLAQEGVTFENTYCNCPLCVPSRASMVSGRLAARLEIFDNGTELPASVPTFMHHLRHGGYEVVTSGKQHFVGPDQLHGYERRLTTDIYPSSLGWTKNWSAPIPPALGMVGRLKQAGPVPWTRQLDYDEEVHFRALEQIRAFGAEARREERDRPWFLCASYTHPHDPPLITEEWWDLYQGVEIDMPDPSPHPEPPLPAADQQLVEYLGLDRIDLTEDDVRRSRRGYYAMTSYFDSRVKGLIEELERQGLRENTIVMVTSDHGDMVGEHSLWFKRSYYEWSARVPWVVSWPGHYPEGRRVSQVVSLVDFYPTLLEMLDLPHPPAEWIDSQSAASLLTGDDPGWKDEAIIDFTSAGARHPWRAVRRGQHKYVAVHKGEPLLFDLEEDPDEWTNLAGRPEVAEVEEELARRATEGWDPEAIEEAEIAAQQRRLFIHEAMQQGEPRSWDYQPFFDASQQYAR